MSMDSQRIRLNQTLEQLDNLCTSPAWRAFSADIGRKIGSRQRERSGSQSFVPGDDWSNFLESVHFAVRNELVTDAGQAAQQASLLLIDCLRQAEQMPPSERTPAITDLVRPRLGNVRWLYIFLVFLTYWRIDVRSTNGWQDDDQMTEVSRLLNKSRLLSIMEWYSSGIANSYITFHGERLFTLHDVPHFINRYYYWHRVGPGDTLHKLVEDRYKLFRLERRPKKTDVLNAWSKCDENTRIRGLGWDDLLLDRDINRIWIVPPAAQNDKYQQAVTDLPTKPHDQWSPLLKPVFHVSTPKTSDDASWILLHYGPEIHQSSGSIAASPLELPPVEVRIPTQPSMAAPSTPTVDPAQIGYTGRILNVLISSPFDVEDERKAAREAIEEWNSLHADADKLLLRPLTSERDSAPEFGDRPQGILNRQLVAKAHLAIVMFGKRLGTSTGIARSGTVEEINEMVKTGRQVMVYFSSRMTTNLLSVDLEQLQGLQAFKKEIEKVALYATFESPEDLKGQLVRHLTHRVRAIMNPHK